MDLQIIVPRRHIQNRWERTMTRLAAQLEDDLSRAIIEHVQLESRLKRRVAYGGKKGRRAAARLKGMAR